MLKFKENGRSVVSFGHDRAVYFDSSGRTGELKFTGKRLFSEFLAFLVAFIKFLAHAVYVAPKIGNGTNKIIENDHFH